MVLDLIFWDKRHKQDLEMPSPGLACDACLKNRRELQALATEIWGKICPPSDQEAIV